MWRFSPRGFGSLAARPRDTFSARPRAGVWHHERERKRWSPAGSLRYTLLLLSLPAGCAVVFVGKLRSPNWRGASIRDRPSFTERDRRVEHYGQPRDPRKEARRCELARHSALTKAKRRS